MRKRTLAEKHALKMAKKDHALSIKTDQHQMGRQGIIKALADGLSTCEFGSLKIKVGNVLMFNSNKRLTS